MLKQQQLESCVLVSGVQLNDKIVQVIIIINLVFKSTANMNYIYVEKKEVHMLRKAEKSKIYSLASILDLNDFKVKLNIIKDNINDSNYGDASNSNSNNRKSRMLGLLCS
jgi:hypothetical protein